MLPHALIDLHCDTLTALTAEEPWDQADSMSPAPRQGRTLSARTSICREKLAWKSA